MKRRDTFTSIVRALSGGDLVLGPGSDREAAMNILSTVPGVGPWTRQVIAMRALGDPDAFPETDLGVRHAAERLGLADDARGAGRPLTALATVARVRGAVPLVGRRPPHQRLATTTEK